MLSHPSCGGELVAVPHWRVRRVDAGQLVDLCPRPTTRYYEVPVDPSMDRQSASKCHQSPSWKENQNHDPDRAA